MMLIVIFVSSRPKGKLLSYFHKLIAGFHKVIRWSGPMPRG